jgi:predicted phosphodiesterase/translation initiation factor 2B subunit (eIF-2B alpha/beta/delta family)
MPDNIVRWLHLSDLHFGCEELYPGIKTIREKLLKFAREKLRRENYQYLFISGDLVYAPEYWKKSEEDKQKIKENIKSFLDEMTNELEITKDNIFIVPGNHDIQRTAEKEKIINKITLDDVVGGAFSDIDFITILKAQKDYINICKHLGVKNFCDKAHKFIGNIGDINVLLLNTTLTTNKDDRRGDLLLDGGIFLKELQKCKNKRTPLIVLAHHGPNWFQETSRIHLREIKNHSELPIFLCGHEHKANLDRYENMDVFFCGTTTPMDIGKAKLDDKEIILLKSNNMIIMTGEIRKNINEAVISSYKWSPKQMGWIPDRDFNDKEPYNKNFVTAQKYQNVLTAKTESMTREALFKYLQGTIIVGAEDLETNNSKDRVNYVAEELARLIQVVITKRSQFRGSIEKLKNSLLIPIEYADGLESVKKIIRESIRKDQEAEQRINEQGEEIFSTANQREKLATKYNLSEGNKVFARSVLLYSKSMQVINLLKALPIPIKRDCTIYICAGNARCMTMYQDAIEIAECLYEEKSGSFYWFKKIQFIPDICFESYLREDKIDLILLGANEVFYNAAGFKSFSNTIGTGLIIERARVYGIPYYIIAASMKFCEEADEQSSFEEEDVRKQNVALRSELGIINKENLEIKYYKSELIRFTDKEISDDVRIITDHSPKENYTFITHETKEKFGYLTKDRRILKRYENEGNIEKRTFNEKEHKMECDVLRFLAEMGLAVPELISESLDDNKITLQYIKGIRVFNFVFLLHQLIHSYDYKPEKKKEITAIIVSILNRCEEQQKKIQSYLYERYKDYGLECYPESKIHEIVDLFFGCFNLVDGDRKIVDREKLRDELTNVYSEFKKNAKVPFRDATPKNMIIECEELFAGNFTNADKNINIEEIDKSRLEHINTLFEQGKLQKLIYDSRIVNIDFSSCIYLTSFSDDVISFKFHEHTSTYFDWKSINLWTENPILLKDEALKSVAATFIIRFLRFGGRKALYRKLINEIHSIRFKYDHEIYYFKKLIEILPQYWPNAETELKETLYFFKRIEKILESNETYFPSINMVVKEALNENVFTDVYPY